MCWYIKQQVMRYTVLMASILVLLSVVIPHHHHRDGMPCYLSLTEEMQHGEQNSDPYDCSCDGHNLAYLNTHTSFLMDSDAGIFLMPLLVLFDYINPIEPSIPGQHLYGDWSLYIESLHDQWIVSATGLRAPPMC
ncbi:hypothetical protein EVA_05164 [gut metagenome]|uniref:Uncharacterized protein n=1 Tax=gut metagenome TaxID=749906 RepID=J9H0B6_9ZZZZ